MNYLKQNHLSLLIAAFLVISAFFGGSSQSFSAARSDLTTVGNPWTFTNSSATGGITFASTTITTLKAGQLGTAITRINSGTCYIQAYAATISASSTAQVDCQATAAVGGITTTNDVALGGVTFGDPVIAMLATTTASSVSNGIVITGASASTTSGYITLMVSNLRGTTFTWPVSGSATGTVSYIITK